jgi:ferredoxin
MKVTIDKNACTGCMLCVDTCPEVFEMQDDIAIAKISEVPDASADTCKQAADDCPSEAILIEEEKEEE